eukprot:SM000199S05415  [mRNA]  locus=s199:101200:103836:+ [translate_table: standard]
MKRSRWSLRRRRRPPLRQWLLAVLVAAVARVAAADSQYATVVGEVVCDSCSTGLDLTWAAETPSEFLALHPPVDSASVSVICDLGVEGTYTINQPTDSDGGFTVSTVPSVATNKGFQSCIVRLNSSCVSNSQSCTVKGTCNDGDVGQIILNATGGTWLMPGETYTVGPFCFLPTTPPDICSLPVQPIPATKLSTNCSGGGALCGDPRLVGGDGVPFWFHGARDADFCIVSDRTLHINAHFIGKPVADGQHDLTWVQAVVVFFENHKLFVGTQQEKVWQSSRDHLLFIFDGEPLLSVSNTQEEAVWQSDVHGVKITRPGKANYGKLEIENLLSVTVEVRPIAKVNWTEDSCFPHMDMSMAFAQLSGRAEGVLGQTYQKLWSPPGTKEGEPLKSYILHDVESYITRSIFDADCPVGIYSGSSYKAKAGHVPHWQRAVLDDRDEPTEVSATCSNDPKGGGLRCVDR